MTDNKTQPAKEREGNAWGRFALIAAVTAAVAAAVVVTMKSNQSDHSPKANQNANASMSSAPLAPDNSAPTPATELVTMDVAKAVMVTVELDFGPKTPTIAEALNQVERRYQPDDGQGRTFAVLDAYGEKLPDGKLHMSMHVSSEKPGGAQLIFKRTVDLQAHRRSALARQDQPHFSTDSTKATDYAARQRQRLNVHSRRLKQSAFDNRSTSETGRPRR